MQVDCEDKIEIEPASCEDIHEEEIYTPKVNYQTSDLSLFPLWKNVIEIVLNVLKRYLWLA